MREVELWNRALREEEKISVENYAKKHGEEKMKAIQESMRERQQKEQKARDELLTAMSSYKKYIAGAMEKRKLEWVTAKKEFMTVKMNELKEKVLEQAKKEHMLEENRRMQLKLQEERRKKD